MLKKIHLITLFILALASSCKEEKIANHRDEKLPKPNIIWFVAEDISPRFACFGDTLALTPTIDAIAKKGMVYQNAFTVSGVCAPSRSSMITGCYPSSIGTQHMRQAKGVLPMPGVPSYNAVPPPDIKAFPELLRTSGYWTASYRKLDYQFGSPFTIWDTISETPTWRMRAKADEKRPFFIYNTYEITHEINIWPDSTKTKFFEDKNINLSKLAKDVVVRPSLDSLGRKIKLSDITLPPYFPDTELARDHIQRLYYNAMRMDQQIAKVIADLKEDGLEDDTILFFMSDHGDCLPRGKRWLYDSGLKSPLIIYIPPKYLPKGFKQPGNDSNLYSFVDLPATVLEMAGVEIPEWIQGKSIISELKEKPRKYVYGSRDRMDNRYDVRRAIRSKNYKYIKNFEPEKPYQQHIEFLERMPLMHQILEMKEKGQLNPVQSAWLADSKPEDELYDIVKDPYEINNLAQDPKFATVKNTMEKDLMSWMESIDDLYLIDEKDQAEKAWPNGEQPTTSDVTFTIKNNILTLQSNTPGASIAYRKPNAERWEIYSHPLSNIEGHIEAKAVRYGYKPSKTTTYTN
ncbi:sulfatase [Tamlana sp. I1]|uniref:sulfatase family protein n=1 Tax=Tamlana sp. I1 TaxID=2762061 RepID=UPI00188EF336|nr:sulfatase [Tamlana sp. I1]